MTREEAIDMLYGMKADNLNLDDAYTKDKYDALEMAIKALEQEPSGDLISRQAVQDYIAKYLSQYLYDDVREAVEVIDEYIGELPSVKQEPRAGHWIFDEILDKHYYCSECKSMGVDYWDFCPYCGAKMVE